MSTQKKSLIEFNRVYFQGCAYRIACVLQRRQDGVGKDRMRDRGGGGQNGEEMGTGDGLIGSGKGMNLVVAGTAAKS